MTTLLRGAIAIASFVSLLLSQQSFAEVGVEKDKILLGSSVALTGPLGEDGKARKMAMEAILKRVNSSGGIRGRKVDILISDDGFDPKRGVENTQKYIEDSKVFALLNYLGTPIATAVLPAVEKSKIPFFGAITGAIFLRMPVKKTVFTVRASFDDEGEALVHEAVDVMHLKEIGLFTQNDALGQAGRTAVHTALSKRELKPVSLGTHERNDMRVAEGVENVMKAKPKAVILWTIGKAAQEFVKTAAAKGYKPIYLAPSSVPAQALLGDLAKDSEGAVFANGYPLETDTSIPIVKQFRSDMAAAGFKDSEMNALAFEAYFNASLFFEALNQTGADLTREKLVNTIEGMNDLNFGGVKVGFGPSNHQALRKVYLLQVKDGKAVPIN